MPTKDLLIYTLTEEREEKLWRDAILIFDSSSLLEIYSCSDSYKATIIDIIAKFMDRIWVPKHVLFEYHKNRLNVSIKPKSEKYHRCIIDRKEVVKCIERIIDDTKNNEQHPYIDAESHAEICTLKEQVVKNIQTIESLVNNQYDIRCKEIIDSANKDNLLPIVESFKTGDGFKFDKILGIIEEGELRYKNDIPPGYMDGRGGNKKEGTQIYGDLIIWKEIIEHAKTEKKSIIFICDDFKIDWGHKENDQKNRFSSPREELIKEIYDETGSEFWIYSLSQFIYQAKNRLALEDKNKVDEIIQFMDNQTRVKTIRQPINPYRNPDLLICKCAECGSTNRFHKEQFDFDFECVGGDDDRGMGPENHYQANEYVECANCDNDIRIEFNIWEYPIGAINHKEIDIDGARLVKGIDYSIDLHDDGDRDLEPCAKCGSAYYDDGGNTGLCSDCNKEYSA